MTAGRLATPARVLVLAGPLLSWLVGCGGQPNALNPSGRPARDIAALWWLMFALAVPVIVIVLGALLAVALRTRRGEGGPSATAASGKRWIYVGGVALPVVVLVPLALVILGTANNLADVAGDEEALVVEVTGHQFWFEIRYPGTGAVTANEVHVPVGREIELRLATADVIHTFWAPDLAGKTDMVPGEDTSLRFAVDRPGVYRGFCTEFCGVQHAGMMSLVVAQEPAEFEAWLAAQATDADPPAGEVAHAGAEVFRRACAGCHTVRGTAADGEIGPDLTHVASRRTLGAGVVENNRGNLAGWVANAQGIKPGNLMPPSALSPGELHAVVAYLEGLR